MKNDKTNIIAKNIFNPNIVNYNNKNVNIMQLKIYNFNKKELKNFLNSDIILIC